MYDFYLITIDSIIPTPLSRVKQITFLTNYNQKSVCHKGSSQTLSRPQIIIAYMNKHRYNTGPNMKLWNRTPLFHTKLHFRYVFMHKPQNTRSWFLTQYYSSADHVIFYVQSTKQRKCQRCRDVIKDYCQSLAIREWPTFNKEVTVRAIKAAHCLWFRAEPLTPQADAQATLSKPALLNLRHRYWAVLLVPLRSQQSAAWSRLFRPDWVLVQFNLDLCHQVSQYENFKLEFDTTENPQ